jgi:hypothetical protein
VCYCVDCQAFANHLSTDHNILDQWGGTDIYQTAPWNVTIDKGIEYLRCLRLTPRGTHRWFTACCNTPVGNTISAKFPFIGLIHSFMDKDDQTESVLGPVRGYHKLESAIGEVPESYRETGMPKGAIIGIYWRILKWKLAGKNKPRLFYDETGKNISKPTVVDSGDETG